MSGLGVPVEDQTIPSRSHERSWAWAWVAVFLFNLPIPLGFGLLVTSEASACGMLVGIPVVWLIGHFAVARIPEVRGALVVGGIFVGVSQAMPILHIVVGALATSAVGAGNDQLRSATDAFTVTLLTAALLSVVALGAGFTLRALGWLLAGRSGTEW